MTEASEKVENRSFEVKVNGIQFEVKQQNVFAREILELAAKHGAMPGKPEEYTLQGDKGEYGWDDSIDLLQDNVFITIPNTPTPVA